jgi:hypothetical protein
VSGGLFQYLQLIPYLFVHVESSSLRLFLSYIYICVCIFFPLRLKVLRLKIFKYIDPAECTLFSSLVQIISINLIACLQKLLESCWHRTEYICWLLVNRIMKCRVHERLGIS